MALTPEEIDQRMMQADQAFKKKEYNQAISILGSITKENPDYAPAYRQLGFILMHSQSQEKALAYLKRAIELSPDDAENWMAMGAFHKRHKAWTEALNAYRHSLQYRKEDTQIMLELLQIYQTLGDQRSALMMATKLKETNPDNIEHLWGYAKLLKEAGENEEALVQYDLLVKSGREDIPVGAVEEWYELMIDFNHAKEAREYLELLSQKHPDDAMLRLLYGRSCAANFEYEQALSLFQNAYTLDPENIKIIEGLAVIYQVMGTIEKSHHYLQELLKNNPLHANALRLISLKHHYTYGDDAFRQLDFAAAHIAELSEDDKIKLHYALGKAYDDVGDLATAFEHYRSGGEMHAKDKGYLEYATFKKVFVNVKKNMGKALFEQNKEQGCESEKPVFIVGMPRSGTSLIEQVLSGIKGIYGAGELAYGREVLNQINIGGFKLDFVHFPIRHNVNFHDRGRDYVERIEALAPEGTKRIIDKMPENFKWLGYLHLILPNASFIHSRRHPIETCLSAYRLHFPKAQYWSDDLLTIGKYYRLYTEMMQHWKEVLPKGTILDVRYEDMVADLEGESKRMAAYIGMPWSEACLNFHQSGRIVRTASASQVSKPIYKNSTNRWRRYEPYLKPLLEEIGDLVEAYEAEVCG
jgi:tetratricopeptide (TPR) repeat protein